jgi:pSer/pThr/pTyr-binding forkhead associated (FHA) protein
MLEDLGSKNGTQLNGTRITQPVSLTDPSEIRIGAVVLTYRLVSTANPTETI